MRNEPTSRADAENKAVSDSAVSRKCFISDDLGVSWLFFAK